MIDFAIPIREQGTAFLEKCVFGRFLTRIKLKRCLTEWANLIDVGWWRGWSRR